MSWVSTEASSGAMLGLRARVSASEFVQTSLEFIRGGLDCQNQHLHSQKGTPKWQTLAHPMCCPLSHWVCQTRNRACVRRCTFGCTSLSFFSLRHWVLVTGQWPSMNFILLQTSVVRLGNCMRPGKPSKIRGTHTKCWFVLVLLSWPPESCEGSESTGPLLWVLVVVLVLQ